MNIEIGKIQQMAIYLAEKIPNLYFTKFLKLVYYLDFISVQEVGSSVTNDTYFALPYGPVPSFVKENIDLLDNETRDLEANLLADPTISTTDEYAKIKSVFDGYITLEKNGGTILKPAEGVNFTVGVLSKYEQDLLDELVLVYKETTVRDIVDQTHKEPPYTQTALTGTIDYRMAFQLNIKEILPDRSFKFDKEISFARFVS
jgi:uncharacterized phage-associated protein